MKKCLIVDDVPLNVVLAQKMLSTMGFEFHKANNGKKACEALSNGLNPDIMILDLMMPVMDGFEVLRHVRSGECGNPDLPIVVLSALNREEDIKRARSLGANDFVTKPIVMNRLITTVEKIMGEK